MKEYNKLYVLKGLPASGKSTFAKNKSKEEPNTVIVNRDKIREMLKGEYKLFPFGSKMEQIVTDIEMSSLQSALALGYDVILDSTGFRWNLSKEYVKSFYEADLEIIDFTHVDLKTCIQRDQQRQNPVGKLVIENMAKKYLNYKEEQWQQEKD